MSARGPSIPCPSPIPSLRGLILVLTFGAGLAGHAQAVDWTGAAGNGLWCDPLNRDLDGLGGPAWPGPGTNVVIDVGVVVTYTMPTAASTVEPLTLAGQLVVSAPGLVVDGTGLTGLPLEPGGWLQLTTAGELVTTNGGTPTLNTDRSLSLEDGTVFLAPSSLRHGRAQL